MLIIIALIFIPISLVFANGNDQVIILTYLPEISTTGERNATGIAVVDLQTGEVAVQVANLKKLSSGHYAVWLTGPNLEAPVYVAALPEDGHLPTVIVSLPEQTFRYVLITVEESAADEDPAAPSEERALAGIFPNEAVVPLLPGIGASGQIVEAETEPPVDKLPETGAILPDRWIGVGGVGLSIGVLVILTWRRLRRSRSLEKGDIK